MSDLPYQPVPGASIRHRMHSTARWYSCAVSEQPSSVRVLVTGASTVSWTSWMSGPRSDYAFPRAIEAALHASGISADVRNSARLGTPTSSMFRTWETDVLQWSPDVIVSFAGHYEAIHLFLPRWFERPANRVDYVPGKFRTFYRRRFLRTLWKATATLQSKIDGAVGARGSRRRRLRRAAHTYEHYVRLSQQVASPMMIVLEVLRPSSRVIPWFPGMPRRVDLLNAELAAAVERIGLPHVQMFRTSDLVESMYDGDQAAATPDGFHFTPELHRRVGADLAARISAWLQAEPIGAPHASTP
jgi:lysophospholipase L1-like esterase